MKKYSIWFELYGKKMKTVVVAENEQKAIEELKNKIVFHRVKEAGGDDYFDKAIEVIDKFINVLDKKNENYKK